ncbi:MAG: hypothetical protein A3G32_07095 [Deltaproteobacteria bacterium RIFCSPLOWO2_12_FULL_40_28]|nr:MAG: hypothetical protein A3C45_07140 [Deltaproteobacteria bacterium RIFCSPHIGHO2_02_FULL_40_28]OGQ19277.1 MAG: hypothetical protein A3E27_04675 [Deltaproteobacteria bacterium RIFCSPHIGHO2_12_FULL_40_32]OGQ40499.1 MAG: hypothetical protein A3I69_00395 [Deltaproteobacteria bacterium RIFCSPLOWO2_02_FULL_40_36]OGQ53735.1 MAG: hypothetical protein A3G32_07095 [Deltaproteobacteria bacterium RIFCSPLOWO2_12_FULL_40_28]
MNSNTSTILQADGVLSRYEKDLIAEGLISEDQLTIAKISQQNLGQDLGTILVKRGYISENILLSFVAKRIGFSFVDLKETKIDPDIVRKVPLQIARQYKVIPLKQNGTNYIVAMANPFDQFALDDLKGIFKTEIEPCLANGADVDHFLDQFYESGEAESENLTTVEVLSEADTQSEAETRKMQEMALGPKVVSAVNNLIARAHHEGASDIHIEPNQNKIIFRFRVDGLLRERGTMPKNMHLPVVSRIKILAELDIAERRIPQDGRVRVMLVGKPLDLRISTCPTQHGEKVVVRLLSKDAVRSIESLGFPDKERRLFSDIISKSHGIFLVTGPTGSGKSTTLYAALTRINSPDRNIISIEDPIENQIEGVNQVNVNPKAGLSFAAVLRSVLRQDPDIIMIGEIRDAETAQIAVRAAITGHMVLSTLHTNTASGAISRLNDLGVESFLLASALKGVLAQRLVRKICKSCRTETSTEDHRYGALTAKAKKAFCGVGCKACHYTGYSGRVGIFELAPITDVIRTLIHEKADESAIVAELRKIGVKSIMEDGIQRIEDGITTLEEVLRVTSED